MALDKGGEGHPLCSAAKWPREFPRPKPPGLSGEPTENGAQTPESARPRTKEPSEVLRSSATLTVVHSRLVCKSRRSRFNCRLWNNPTPSASACRPRQSTRWRVRTGTVVRDPTGWGSQPVSRWRGGRRSRRSACRRTGIEWEGRLRYGSALATKQLEARDTCDEPRSPTSRSATTSTARRSTATCRRTVSCPSLVLRPRNSGAR